MILHKRKHQVPGLNTTSTADISFMLLIFFLVTTSMDVDKGLMRKLPLPQSKNQPQQVTQIDERTLMVLHVTGKGQLLMNEKPIKVEQLQEEMLRFVHRLGTRHLVSIESDRNAPYDLYFQMQNQLMSAYAQWRNEYAKKNFGKPYDALSKVQKDKTVKACPQRITESYAQACSFTDKSVSADAEEKGGKQ